MIRANKKIVIASRTVLTQLLLLLYISVFLTLKEQKINLFYLFGVFIGTCTTVFLESTISNTRCRKVQKHINNAKYKKD